MLCATMGLNEKILPASLPSLNDRMTLLWQLCAEQWSNRPVLSKSHLSDKMRSNCFFILYLYTLNLLLYDNYSVTNTLHQEFLESTKTSDNYNHDCTLQSRRTYKPLIVQVYLYNQHYSVDIYSLEDSIKSVC